MKNGSGLTIADESVEGSVRASRPACRGLRLSGRIPALPCLPRLFGWVGCARTEIRLGLRVGADFELPEMYDAEVRQADAQDILHVEHLTGLCHHASE